MKLKNKILNISFAIVLITMLILGEKYKGYRVDKNKVYTSGTIKGHSSTRGGEILRYEINYKGRRYINKMSTDLNDEILDKIIEKEFIVKLDSTKPKWNYLLLDKMLIDSVITPDNGWKEINKLLVKTTHNTQ